MMEISLPRRRMPAAALLLLLLGLVAPAALQPLLASSAAGFEGFLWSLALLPVFLLAYYRGGRGVAMAVACTLALFSTTQVVLLLLGRGGQIGPPLLGALTLFLLIALGIGWMAELLHRERAQAEQRSLTDPLTQLPNRRLGELVLEREFAAAERGRPVTLALFDLDHFKRYNDAYGHTAGDQALVAFARVLREKTRRMNLSARYGGEEFVSVLSDVEQSGALVFVDQVRDALASLDLPGGPLTVSVGVATYHPGMRSAEELYAAADQALYTAKERGKDLVVCYSTAESSREIRALLP